MPNFKYQAVKITQVLFEFAIIIQMERSPETALSVLEATVRPGFKARKWCHGEKDACMSKTNVCKFFRPPLI